MNAGVVEEFECTVGIVFDANLYGHVRSALTAKAKTRVVPVTETVDVYSDPVGGGGQASRYRKRRSVNDNGTLDVSHDRKVTRSCHEAQVPYLNASEGRILFLCGSYKESAEHSLTEGDWNRLVESAENHLVSTTPVRVYNKRREVYGSADFEGCPLSVPAGCRVRVSIGDFSVYGGTLEARIKCNPISYMEIEAEYESPLDRTTVDRTLSALCRGLVRLVGYELVAAAMRAANSYGVQRERTDCLFDSFKRRFVDFKSYGRGLERSAVDGDLAVYVMPKWDGVRAVATYYDGHAFVRNCYGEITTYRAELPFDNDVILQLEVVDGGKYMVITEIMAVIVKSQNTTYQAYGKNNALSDTGRYSGNVANSIVMTKQFKDPNDVCNLYRLVTPSVSLSLMRDLSVRRHRHLRVGRLSPSATSMAAANVDRPVLMLTTVVRLSNEVARTALFSLLSEFFGSEGTRDFDEHRTTRLRCVDAVMANFPSTLLDDKIFRLHASNEGLIVAFADGRVLPSLRRPRDHGGSTAPLFDHCYVKMKRIDTVDLETRADGRTFSADLTEYRVHGLPRAAGPTIVECHYDRRAGRLTYTKTRRDKTAADRDDKIAAVDPYAAGEAICNLISQ